MESKIITIGREFGSGGRIIGKKLAQTLGYDFYDKELIGLIAEKSGYAEDFIELNAENRDNRTSSIMYNVFANADYAMGMFANFSVSTVDQLYSLQSRIITEIADKNPCVIVGRCADYILRKRSDCLNVFIHADFEARVARSVSEYSISEKNARKEVQWQDKTRASHYKYYTENEWGSAKNYHLTLDSGCFDIEGCVDIMLHAARMS